MRKIFKERYLEQLLEELNKTNYGYATDEENDAYKDGIVKAFKIFEELSKGKEVLAVEPFCEISRVDPKDL